jgi:hypothetical protein
MRPACLSRFSSRSSSVLRQPAPPRSPSRPGGRILGPRRASLRVIETRVRSLRGSRPAACYAPSDKSPACSLRGRMVTAGWTCYIRAGLVSIRSALLASINSRTDSLAILPFIACCGLTPPTPPRPAGAQRRGCRWLRCTERFDVLRGFRLPLSLMSKPSATCSSER